MRFLPFVVASLPLAWATDATFRVYHRIYEPNQPESLFLQRGAIVIPALGDASFQPSSSLAQDLTQFADALQAVKGALYQVALEREGDGGQWDTSAVQVCHLHQATSESFIIHTTPGDRPYALDYFVAPTPHNGACPKKSKSKSALHSFAHGIDSLNRTVVLRAARLPPLPELRVPPPLSPEGEPIIPPPEKSFFAKYWMYGLAILVALALSGGAEEEEKK
ncbi:hypothetical protein C8J57DRAFT_1293889 [Mycena rebaudengoi]|nr:hypothetical protein C8J57DRAFT_1293889 [Mycena rebaudengoi]